MLYDCDRPKISETAQHQIEKTRIQKISALGVTKFSAGQFAQRGREITPGVGIGNWSEGKGEALPDGPGKNDRKGSPIAGLPKRGCFPRGRLIACEWCDHFQGSANVSSKGDR